MQYRHSFILLSWSELRAGDPSLVGIPLWIWRWPPLGRLQQARHEGAWLRLCLLMSLPCFFKVSYLCLSDLLSFCLLKTNFLLAHRSILSKILKGTTVTFIPLVSLVLARLFPVLFDADWMPSAQPFIFWWNPVPLLIEHILGHHEGQYCSQTPSILADIQYPIKDETDNETDHYFIGTGIIFL